jgi:pyrroline-5-carboxylate reductase
MLITYIGGGNMATALISGIQKSRNTHLTIRVADPSEEARNRIQAELSVEVYTDASKAANGADVVVLAVKPQVMPMVLESLSGELRTEQLVLSIAAGTTIESIENRLGREQAIARAMPNTPALIGMGISGVYASEQCKPHHRQQAEKILNATGEVVWVDSEEMIDAVTAVSGSGPAYFFLLTEALANAGTALGLPPAIANQLALQTARGAGAMAAASDLDVAELRRQVTSPNGTTQAAIEIFEAGNFHELVEKAVAAAASRSRELV